MDDDPCGWVVVDPDREFVAAGPNRAMLEASHDFRVSRRGQCGDKVVAVA
jgi:hypothetical protein